MENPGLVLKGHGIEAKNLRQWAAVSESIYLFDVEAASVLSQWQKLRDLVDVTGYWPIILGDHSSIWNYEETFRYQELPLDVGAILREGESIDAEAWFDE